MIGDRERQPEKRNRSLTMHDTLDQLLGMGLKKDGSEKTDVAKVDRPPTRHGRDSLKSTSPDANQNGDSAQAVGNENRTNESLEIWTNASADEVEDTERTFVEKLNEMRRKSILVSDSQHINVTQPSSISPAVKQPPPVSPLSSIEEQRTFRIDNKTETPQINEIRSTPSKPPVTPLFGKSSYEAWISYKDELEKFKRREQKRLLEEKKQAQKQKEEDAKKVFESWKKSKAEALKKEKEEQLRKLAEKRENEVNENKLKKENARKAFEAWLKDRNAKEAEQKKKTEERIVKLRQNKAKNDEEKQSMSETAVREWLDKKDEEMRRLREEKESIIQKELERKEGDAEYKEVLAEKAFSTWVELKEREDRHRRTLEAKLLEFENEIQRRYPIPWIPPSRTSTRSSIQLDRRKLSEDRKRRTHSAAGRTQSRNLRKTFSMRSLRNV